MIWPTILGFVKSLATQPGWTIYPPLSGEKIEIKENIFSRIYPKLYFAYIVMTMFGVFVFYKLGKLYNRPDHNSQSFVAAASRAMNCNQRIPIKNKIHELNRLYAVNTLWSYRKVFVSISREFSSLFFIKKCK